MKKNYTECNKCPFQVVDMQSSKELLLLTIELTFGNIFAKLLNQSFAK